MGRRADGHRRHAQPPAGLRGLGGRLGVFGAAGGALGLYRILQRGSLFPIHELAFDVVLGALGRHLAPDHPKRRRVLGAALVCYILGFVGVAAGISGLAPLQLAGTLSLTLAVVLLAVLLGHRARQAYTAHDATLPAALLALAALSVPLGLALASWYAFGQWPGPPTLTIDTMIHTHGFINALGFALPALVGLTLLPE